jgi:SAM-dependent methyltransferase
MPDKSAKKSGEWYKRAFADDYLFVYAHRTAREAIAQVEVAVRHLPFAAGQRVLDIACGSGRHLLAFARLGARVTGVDLSPVLLDVARRRFARTRYRATFKLADMRESTFKQSFDGATIWFTSIGYFATQDEDLRALRSMAGALKKGGWWWIDIPNPAYLIPNLVPESVRMVSGPHGRATIEERRRIVGNSVVKEIVLTDEHGQRNYEERVRLYTPEQFGSLVKLAGLVTDGILGDYDGSALAASRPRQIWYGRKP